jgi:ribosomal protein S2
MNKIVKILYGNDCHIVSTKYSWNRNLASFLYCEHLLSFYLDLRFSAFFLQQYLKFLKYLATGGFHFYFVTHQDLPYSSFFERKNLNLNSNLITIKKGNWFPGTLTNWRISKDLRSPAGKASKLYFPSVIILFDSPSDNYAVSEVTKLDLISCIFADSKIDFTGKSFTEVIPLGVNFSYKKVLSLLMNLSFEAILEGDIDLFRAFTKYKL